MLSRQTPYTSQDFEDGDDVLIKDIPGVPKQIMAVLKKALKDEQGERFQSAEAFKQALVEAMNAKRKKGGRKGGSSSWLIPVLIGVLLAVIGGACAMFLL